MVRTKHRSDSVWLNLSIPLLCGWPTHRSMISTLKLAVSISRYQRIIKYYFEFKKFVPGAPINSFNFKYSSFQASHIFVPVAVETSGACAPLTLTFLSELGRRMEQTSREKREKLFLLQRVSVAIQQGNYALTILTYNSIYYHFLLCNYHWKKNIECFILLKYIK